MQHQPRGTCEAPAPPPVHQALRKDKWIPESATESIHRYQFLDEERRAKVFIPLDAVGDLPDASIESEFKETSFMIRIKDYKPNIILQLSIPSLEGEVLSFDVVMGCVA